MWHRNLGLGNLGGQMREHWCRMFMAMILAVMVSGCATLTIEPKGERKITSHPTYEKRQTFFLWGLVGDPWIDVSNVCGSSEVKQMQTQFTFVDEVLSFITLGIYAPRTAKIWCS